MRRLSTVGAVALLVLAVPEAQANAQMVFALEELEDGPPADNHAVDADASEQVISDPEVAASDIDFKAEVAQTMGPLRWGMSKKEVIAALSDKIKKEYRDKISRTQGLLEQDKLVQRMYEDIRRLGDNFVVFNGKVTGWDLLPIKHEYRHGTREAMLVMDDGHSRNFYFFIGNRLWKYYKAFKENTFDGRSFEEVSRSLLARFGPARKRRGQRTENAPQETWLEWTDPELLFRAVPSGRTVVFVFSHRATLTKLSHLRKNAINPKRKRKASLVDWALSDS